MADLYGYNPDEDYGSFGSDPIPVGEYLAAIVESEERQNKRTEGTHVNLDFEIIEGPHKGRHVFNNLNLNNRNPVTMRIAKAELKAICDALGGLRPQGSRDLHDQPLRITLGLKKREDTGEAQNVIKSYKPEKPGAGARGRAKATEVDSAPATAPAAESNTPPWKRK